MIMAVVKTLSIEILQSRSKNTFFIFVKENNVMLVIIKYIRRILRF